MFLHAANWEQKGAEQMVHWGCGGSVYNPESEMDQSAMELVGYHTSWREMRDVYQSIYLLWRAPGVPPCGAQSRRKAIQDILSSLKGQLHKCGHSAAIRNLEPQEEQVRPNWWGFYVEALRAACQRALDTTKALTSDIKRLGQRRRGRSQSCSRNCSWSRSCSRTRSQSRSCRRAHRQHCSQGNLQNLHAKSPDGPCQEEESPSGTLKQKWALKETPKTPGIRDPWKLAQKIRGLFYIPEVRMRTLLEPGYPVPPLRGVLIEMPSYQLTYPIKMCGKYQPSWWLLTPGVSSIGQRNKVCQEARTSIPWQKVSLSYGRQ